MKKLPGVSQRKIKSKGKGKGGPMDVWSRRQANMKDEPQVSMDPEVPVEVPIEVPVEVPMIEVPMIKRPPRFRMARPTPPVVTATMTTGLYRLFKLVCVAERFGQSQESSISVEALRRETRKENLTPAQIEFLHDKVQRGVAEQPDDELLSWLKTAVEEENAEVAALAAPPPTAGGGATLQAFQRPRHPVSQTIVPQR